MPISKISRQIEEAEAEITSNLLFPGDLVLVYPRIKEQRMINESEDKEIDFSHLNRVLGEELGLKKLAKRKIIN